MKKQLSWGRPLDQRHNRSKAGVLCATGSAVPGDVLAARRMSSDHDRPSQQGFQQVSLRGDGLGRWAAWYVSLGGDDQRFVLAENSWLAHESIRAALPTLGCDEGVLDLDTADVAVVDDIQGIRQAQDRCQPRDDLLLAGKHIAQGLVAGHGQPTAVKASHDGRALHGLRAPSQGSAMGLDQLLRHLVMSLVALHLAHVVQKSGQVETRARIGAVAIRGFLQGSQ